MLVRPTPDECSSYYSITGTLNNSKLSARAVAYVLTGHEKHHIHVLKEKYLLTQS
ncbi:hypothetical protein [Brevibacillus sp. NRS-1366]|uniref:hypothetical protein n=1 Tax=Brevibacillus sp. NRS-1366 TaxID=3233899 RepID=UPI003D1FF704